MFGLSALVLARIQFAFTMSFHILFPAVTIGLASYLAVLELSWLRTKRQVFVDLYHFWLKIFAVMFGMGVVSGIVMAYQIGTNWSYMSEFAGSIMGPVLAYEVLTAFFLEAGFLGVMLFGWNRVGPALHLVATCMVAAGTLISATWILAANSWMQTPRGYAIEGGRMVPTDWLAIVFNPSFPYRLLHMVVAAYLTTALIVGAVGAWQLLHKRDNPAVRKMLSMAMWMVLIVAPIQAVIGDFHGLNTAKHQPAKLAAMEGHWENTPGEAVPLKLFGIPDMEEEKTHFSVEVPHLGSVILTHSWAGQFPGLKEFRKEDRPNSLIVFWSFRTMVGLGLLMIGLGLWSLFMRRGGRLFTSRVFLRAALIMGPAGLVAILAGWITTEVGRQPWVVYGVLRTSDAVSKHGAPALALTLGLFVAAYLVVFGAGTAYVLRMMRKGPQKFELHRALDGGPGEVRTPMRPLSAADVANHDDAGDDAKGG
ncbi:cytochrome ubiquinol oxidase subunit I [Massilia sp. Dwa41.01b]|uniref:cytochrome ubiquinol oxidase subunit I n=1 Tax=unclassified Massilia TaxID=2609279 RepID=UPI001601718E|nr:MULTISPECIES: cytochrome ubiquinol oxidase subunit I [unclassified Massilia]QNA89493.1 cytochrome ubiquinol oxidase subunit I [Massilia sp. Dwa41.01b]QNB00398.1 cytochrome ubiquinol oxidase subunit I [Massilia sp. Se16.2.3]